ncbi:Iron-Sulfur Cluster Assembly 1-like [Manis pentadactyla]|nr:Iron-Sulfur Cluster Assembly 1-like [Manis pentadactyla]
MSASLVRATVRAVSKRKLQPTRAALTLTPSAVNKIKQLIKDKPEHVGVKVGVRTRGCNGLSYTLEYTKTKGDSDEEVVQDGVRVFIEKKAQLTLLGTEMDYIEDKLSTLNPGSQAHSPLKAWVRSLTTQGSGSPEETTGVRVTGQTEQGSPNKGDSQSPVIPIPARHMLHPAAVTYANITQCPGALNILTHEPPTYQVPGCAPSTLVPQRDMHPKPQ